MTFLKNSLIAAFLFGCMPLVAPAQSATFYLCNDCTYRSAKDGETITFMNTGRVLVNGALNRNMSCRNNDGVVELYYKGKLVNKPSWSRAQDKGYDLLDLRGIGYTVVDCTGDMPSPAELNSGRRR